MSQVVYEGTWEDIERHASELRGHRVRLTIVGDEQVANGDAPLRAPGHLYFGMFKDECEVSDEDFELTEWRGEDLDV